MTPPGAADPRSTSGRTGRSGSDDAFRVVVIGGGVAGSTVVDVLAAQDEAPKKAPSVALIEPSTVVYDQPTWVDVGTEGLPKEETRQDRTPLSVPDGAVWIQEAAARIDPDAQIVETVEGRIVRYEVLVVAVGVEMQWGRIRGLQRHLGAEGICSVYGYEQADRTWEMIQAFEGGEAVFTAPSSPYKGASAPLDVLRRAEDVWRETGVRSQTNVTFTTAAQPEYAGEAYEEIVQREAASDDVSVYFEYELIEVRPEHREAVFRISKGASQSERVLTYDLLHVVPPMYPPSVIAESALAYPVGTAMNGYLDVDPTTLQHKRYPNVYGAGDVAGVRAVKTGAQARKQARELADRIGGASLPEK